MQNLAVIGLGKWGKHLVREFSKISNVVVCCSLGDLKNKDWLKSNYPKIKYTNKIAEIIENKSINSVVIATPIDTHYTIAEKMLLSGKNVFLEKPMATKVQEALDLYHKSLDSKGKLLIGHIFLYHEVFNQIKKIIAGKKIQEILFEWNKYGSFSEDIKWNLLSHDIALLIKLIGIPSKIKLLDEELNRSSTNKGAWILEFISGTKCRIYINRTSKIKSKKITITLKNQKIIWQNEILYSDQNGTLKEIYKPQHSALSLECQDFLDSINQDRSPLSDGKLGLEVVKQICSI